MLPRAKKRLRRFIAEGVETAEQDALVQLLGCDFIQGYFTGRPMPLDRLEVWLNEPAALASGTFRANDRLKCKTPASRRAAGAIFSSTIYAVLYPAEWQLSRCRCPFPRPTKRQAGDEIRNEMGGAEAFLSPFYRRTPKNDPLAREFLDVGASLGKPRQVVSDGEGGERRLTQTEHREYQRLAGRYIRDDLTTARTDPEWQDLTPGERKRALKRITARAREDARADLGLEGDGFSDIPPGFVPFSDLPEGMVPVSPR